MIRKWIVSCEVWLGGGFGVVISWEMMLKNFEGKGKKNGKGKEKEKRKNPLTFNFSVFFSRWIQMNIARCIAR